MLYRLFRVIILSSIYSAATAQSPWDNYELFTTKHGLPHNTVQALLQDSDGFLWVGTHSGLCVYDGNKLNVYENVFGKEAGNNWFYEAIFEDKDKNIWIASRNGKLSCYIKKEHRFKQHRFPFSQTDRVNCFYQEKNGTIWLANSIGEIGFVVGDSVQKYDLGLPNISDIKKISPEAFALLSDHGLFIFNATTKKLTPVGIKGWGKEQVITGKFSDAGNTVMVLHNTGYSIIDLNTRQLIKTMPIPTSKYSLFHRVGLSNRGNFIYTNGLSIYEYTPHGSLIDSLTISENEWYNKNEVVNCLTEDRSGILWLGTNSGLYKIDRKKYQFKKYAANHVSTRLTDNYVRTLFIDKQNDLWVGFRGSAVNRLHFDKQSKKHELSVYPAQMPDGIFRDIYTINTICSLRSGAILFGSATGIYQLNSIKTRLIFYMPRYIPDTVAEVWALYEDSKGNIWIGSRLVGLHIFEPSTHKLYHYKHIEGDESSLSNSSVWTIFEDSKGTLWLGTDEGLNEVVNTTDIADLKFKRFLFTGKQAEHVWNIAESRDGKLYVGTIGEGLFEISADRTKARHLDNFPAEIVASMGLDTVGNLWAGSANGLYKYNPATDRTTFFSEDDGLASNDFNFKACIKAPTGEFLFGSKMGITSFHPAKVIPKDLHSVPVRITSLRIAGYDSSAALYRQAPLQLTRRQNLINIGFAVLDFTKPLRHTYRYKLNGFEEKWNYRDANQPSANYTNLSPGHYSFVVQGSGDGLHWSDSQATLDFYIWPALWQRPVVQLLAGLIILMSGGGVVYYKTRSVVRKERERNKIEKQIAGLELKALQAQMNPHFIFNALNSIQQFVIHNNELAANDYLTRFARLMRLFLESSKNRYITLETELDQLDLYLSLEKLRFDDKFDYVIKVESGLKRNEILIPSMLIQPFAENAINHGLVHKTSKGKLLISFTRPAGHLLKCTIDDDGVGRDEARRIEEKIGKKYISRGMQLIEERVKTYNFIEDLEIEILITDKQPPYHGTKVDITIPISPSVKT